MGTIKDRNGMDLKEPEDIQESGKNTQKNYTKKVFMTQIINLSVYDHNLEQTKRT